MVNYTNHENFTNGRKNSLTEPEIVLGPPNFIFLNGNHCTVFPASIGHFTEKIGHFSERQLATFLNANWSLFCKPIGRFSVNQLVTFLKIN